MPRASRTSQAALASATALDVGSSSGAGAREIDVLDDRGWTSRTRRGTNPSASVSSTSLTSPLVSSHGDLSEAESYATRGAISGVETTLDEENEDNEQQGQHDNDNDNNDNDNDHKERGSSMLLQDSDDDEEAGEHAEVDSLADASPEEVEAKVWETLGWSEVGKDKELPVIDLNRWKEISDQYLLEGTPEHLSVKAIHASLLEAVSDLDSTDWLYPEPFVFSAGHFNPSSTFSGMVGSSRPAFNQNHPSLELSWPDAAFNPFSNFDPSGSAGHATLPSYPDAERVGIAIENSRLPNVSFLDAQAEEYLGDQETSFAANSNFPWARSMSTRPPAASASTGRSSLAREVGIITL